MKYLSLFSGIGGFELGIQQAYEDIISNKEQMPKQKGLQDRRNNLHTTSKRNRQDRNKYPSCVAYSEIDKYAIQIYEKHFPTHTNFGDITKINPKELPDFDFLVGGFPCPSFSIAGKRKGFNDPRGELFFDIVRILKNKRPRYFLLENVKGLLSSDNGKTFQKILRVLSDSWYDCQWQVLNSKNFGVPQNRERVFIIGHLRGTPRPEVFPFGGECDQTTPIQQEKQGKGKRIQGEISSEKGSDVSTKDRGRGSGRSSTRLKEITSGKSQGNRVYDPSGLSTTITSHAGGQGGKTGLYCVASRGRNPKNLSDRTVGAPTEQRLEPNSQGITNTLTSVQKDNLVLIPEATKKGYAEAKAGDSINLAVPGSKTRRGRVGKNIAQTIDTGMQQYTLTPNSKIRRLTPIECERLQGFPDGWTKYGINEKGEQIEISDTQRYKTLGNAVTTNVVKQVIHSLYTMLL